MDHKVSKFLQVLLGDVGSCALEKATSQDSGLESAVLPRAILSWLNLYPDTYSGCVPGHPESRLEFKKSGNDYEGFLTLESQAFDFKAATVFEIAAGVALGLDHEPQGLDPRVSDRILERLGKNMDLMVGSRLEILRKAISDIGPGIPQEDGSHDYSHVLRPEHQTAGYRLTVHPQGTENQFLEARITPPHGGHEDPSVPVGMLESSIVGKGVRPDVAALKADRFKGQGFGQALYEATFAHAQRHHGVTEVHGDVHSTDASRVHQALAAKHGLNYVPQAQRGVAGKHGAYDQKFGPYKYTLKTELPGKMAGPKAPLGAIPPQGPSRKQLKPGAVPEAPTPPAGAAQPSVPKTPATGDPANKPVVAMKKPSLKVAKSALSRCCEICGDRFFSASRFIGCSCTKELAKSIKSTSTDTGLLLEFRGREWDQSDIESLLLAIYGE